MTFYIPGSGPRICSGRGDGNHPPGKATGQAGGTSRPAAGNCRPPQGKPSPEESGRMGPRRSRMDPDPDRGPRAAHPGHNGLFYRPGQIVPLEGGSSIRIGPYSVSPTSGHPVRQPAFEPGERPAGGKAQADDRPDRISDIQRKDDITGRGDGNYRTTGSCSGRE